MKGTKSKDFAAWSESKIHGETDNYVSTPLPICPHCGEMVSAIDTYPFYKGYVQGSENKFEETVTCDHCNKSFDAVCQVRLELFFTTTPNTKK